MSNRPVSWRILDPSVGAFWTRQLARFEPASWHRFRIAGRYDDFALLDTVMRQQIDFVVQLENRSVITRWLSRRGVPFLRFAHEEAFFPNCVGTIVGNRMQSAAGSRQLAAGEPPAPRQPTDQLTNRPTSQNATLNCAWQSYIRFT